MPEVIDKVWRGEGKSDTRQFLGEGLRFVSFE